MGKLSSFFLGKKHFLKISNLHKIMQTNRLKKMYIYLQNNFMLKANFKEIGTFERETEE